MQNQKHLFYKEFRPTNASLILGLIIISLGTFIIPWFYERSKEFQLLDNNAPDSQRAATVLALIPLGWFIISLTIKKLIFTNIAGNIIEIIGWIFIGILIIKFLLDFCESFGKITGTKGIYWFGILMLGSIGLISLIFQFIYLSFLVIILILVIPAMQLELNSHFSRITIKKNTNIFYE